MNADFFNSLPKPGQCIQVPGGVVWCESWRLKHTLNGKSHGEIVFRFTVDVKHVVEAMPPPALPAPSLALTATYEAEVDPPSVFECIDVIAAKMGVSSDACRMALFFQSVDLGLPFEGLVHKQYRTALGMQGNENE